METDLAIATPDEEGRAVPQLPFEVWAKIFRFLKKPRGALDPLPRQQDLCSCMRVNSMFNAAAVPILYHTVNIDAFDQFAVGLSSNVELSARSSFSKSQCISYIRNMYIEKHPALMSASKGQANVTSRAGMKRLQQGMRAVASVYRTAQHGAQGRVKHVALNYAGSSEPLAIRILNFDLNGELVELLHAIDPEHVCIHGHGLGNYETPSCPASCSSTNVTTSAPWTAYYGLDLASPLSVYLLLRLQLVTLVPAMHFASFDPVHGHARSLWGSALSGLAGIRSAMSDYCLKYRRDPYGDIAARCKHVWTIYPPVPSASQYILADKSNRQSGGLGTAVYGESRFPEPFATMWRQESKACIRAANRISESTDIDLEIRMVGLEGLDGTRESARRQQPASQPIIIPERSACTICLDDRA